MEAETVRLEELVPHMVCGNVLSEWLLFRTERRTAPRPVEPGALILSEMRLYGSGRGVRQPQSSLHAQFLDALAKPILLMSEARWETYAIGSGWMFAGNLDENGPGKTSSNVNISKRVRYMVFERNGLANTVLCHQGEGSIIHCLVIQELGGRYNRSYYLTIDRDSWLTKRVATTIDRRSCLSCQFHEKHCSCSCTLDLLSHDEAFQFRNRQVKSPQGTAYLLGPDYVKSWMQGAWIVSSEHNGVSEPFGMLEALCRNKGATFDSAVTQALQGEVSATCPPAASARLVSAAANEHFLAQSQQRGGPLHSEADEAALQWYETRGPTSKPFWCERCRIGFSKQFEFSRHRAILHEQGKAHKCKICSKSFYQTGHLNEHVRSLHGGSGGHPCKLCSKTFGVKSKLDRHVQTVHNNSRLFTCHICRKSYKEKSYLKQHLATLHKV